jgi:hypothetical protein
MKSSKYILFVLCFLTCFSVAKAQSIAHYFVQMPDNLIPTVKLDTRRDLIDFFKNGKSAVMPAAFGGEVNLKELSEDYLLLQTSENTDLQLKLLKVDDTLRVLALVQTVAGPLKASVVQFFSTLWKPLDNIAFPQFTYLDFLDAEKGKALGIVDRFKEISLRNFVSYKFRQDIPQLVVYSSIREDLSPEILKDFEPVIKDSLTYDWNGSSFKLKNSN